MIVLRYRLSRIFLSGSNYVVNMYSFNQVTGTVFRKESGSHICWLYITRHMFGGVHPNIVSDSFLNQENY